jgi:hypothetical protein
MPDPCDERGQLSLPVVEAAIGAVLVIATLSTFALAPPDPPTREAQLDRYAADAGRALAGEGPRHGEATRLSEVVESEAAFERERDALARRIERILPDNLLYSVETPHGAVGFDVPANAPVGVERLPTAAGTVVIRVWYA